MKYLLGGMLAACLLLITSNVYTMNMGLQEDLPIMGYAGFAINMALVIFSMCITFVMGITTRIED